jgi:hypothetical protein
MSTARDVLLLACAGVLLAVFLRTLAQWVHRRTRLHVGVALAAVVVILLGGIALIFWTRGPSIAAEFDTLRQDIPRAAAARSPPSSSSCSSPSRSRPRPVPTSRGCSRWYPHERRTGRARCSSG